MASNEISNEGTALAWESQSLASDVLGEGDVRPEKTSPVAHYVRFGAAATGAANEYSGRIIRLCGRIS